MAEPNGNERDARLNRIEQEHEDFRRGMRDLLTAQVIQKGEIDDLLKDSRLLRASLELERDQRKAGDDDLGQRVQDLVSAIGDLIRRIPPENLR
jgi:hypothetical protein